MEFIVERGLDRAKVNSAIKGKFPQAKISWKDTGDHQLLAVDTSATEQQIKEIVDEMMKAIVNAPKEAPKMDEPKEPKMDEFELAKKNYQESCNFLMQTMEKRYNLTGRVSSIEDSLVLALDSVEAMEKNLESTVEKLREEIAAGNAIFKMFLTKIRELEEEKAS